jgi:hypothetical protein
MKILETKTITTLIIMMEILFRFQIIWNRLMGLNIVFIIIAIRFRSRIRRLITSNKILSSRKVINKKELNMMTIKLRELSRYLFVKIWKRVTEIVRLIQVQWLLVLVILQIEPINGTISIPMTTKISSNQIEKRISWKINCSSKQVR